MIFGNKKWLASRLDELEGASEVMDTSHGPVEFSLQGSAPYMLVFHATPGGHDQNMAGTPFLEAGLGVITPSRPGYLRTPLATGQTFEDQADANAALLDALGVDRVVVHGISGGGPAAIQFAARHPGRTYALLLSSAVTQAHSWDIPAWSRYVNRH